MPCAALLLCTRLYPWGGYRADKQLFDLTLPGLLEKGCVVTVAFEYVGDKSQQAVLYLAGVGCFLFATKVEWPFTTRQTVVSQCIGMGEYLKALWYSQQGGEPDVLKGLLVTYPTEYLHLFTGWDQYGYGLVTIAKVPLLIHEVHFTMDDPGAAVKAAKANPKTANYALFNITQDLPLGVGGFVLFYGEWKPGTS
ncbi:hypothetical protein MTO96_018563 [Rhipicephalus appendiculatus]